MCSVPQRPSLSLVLFLYYPFFLFLFFHQQVCVSSLLLFRSLFIYSSFFSVYPYDNSRLTAMFFLTLFHPIFFTFPYFFLIYQNFLSFFHSIIHSILYLSACTSNLYSPYFDYILNLTYPILMLWSLKFCMSFSNIRTCQYFSVFNQYRQPPPR